MYLGFARLAIAAFSPALRGGRSFSPQPLLQQASFSAAGDASGAAGKACPLLRHAPEDVQQRSQACDYWPRSTPSM